jgi:hypothetical protein
MPHHLAEETKMSFRHELPRSSILEGLPLEFLWAEKDEDEGP